MDVRFVFASCVVSVSLVKLYIRDMALKNERDSCLSHNLRDISFR